MLNKLSLKGLLALTAFGLAFGHASAQQGRVMEVHGSTTVARTVLIPHMDALNKATGRNIHVIANGSSKGIIALITGKADVAMISAPFEDVKASVERKVPGAIGKTQLKEHRIGGVKTRFIVHPENPVRSLREDQLRDILLGRITNWRELGGPDMRIAIFTTKAGKGLRSLVEKQLLNGKAIVGTAQELAGLQQVVKVIGQAKHGIGFVNEPRLNASVFALPGVFAEQPLILVTKGDANNDVRALIQAMSQRAPS